MHCLRLCPGLEVILGSGESFRIKPGKNGLLLLRLAMSPRALSRDELSEFLWPDADVIAGRARLRVALNGLKAESGLGDAIRGERTEISLDWQQCDTDVQQFERAMEAAAPDDPSALLAAASLLEGEFGSQYSHSWVAETRRKLRERRVEAIARAASVYREAGELERAEDCIRLVLDIEPYREALQIEYAEILVATRRNAELATYVQDVSQAMLRDLGVEPGPRLLEFAQRALSGSPGGEPSSGDVFVDLVGRKTELANLARALGTSRLVTLMGPGGIGKTTLASAAEIVLAPTFPGGIHRVELASLSSGADALPSILRALGLSAAGVKDPFVAIADRLRRGRHLLVLDNCEHVVDSVSGTIKRLLSLVPTLRILCTSRVTLRVPGETQMTVPPLEAPDPRNSKVADMRHLSGVRLFLSRVQAFDPEFDLSPEMAGPIADIVSRVQGMPLALELAAARVRTLPVHEVAERLRQSFDLLAQSDSGTSRHGTMDQTIAWSYDLLSEAEKRAFARLCVLPSPWVLADAEQVLGAQTQTLNLVTLFVEKSLVVRQRRQEGYLFTIYETLRSFGKERLNELGLRDVAEDAFIESQVAYVSQVSSRHHDAGAAAFIDGIEAKLSHLVEALYLSVDRAERVESAIAIALAMDSYWTSRGSTAQGLGFMRRILPVIWDAPCTDSHRRAFELGWRLAVWEEEPEVMLPFATRHFEICSDGGDRAQIAGAQYNIARSHHVLGDLSRALAAYDEAIAQSMLTENTLLQLRLNVRAMEVARSLEDRGRAERYYEQSLASPLLQGNGWTRYVGVEQWAETALWIGRDLREVADLLQTGLEGVGGEGNPRWFVYSITGAAILALHLEDYESAAILEGFFLAGTERSGITLGVEEQALADDRMTLLKANLDAATLQKCLSEGRPMSRSEAMLVAEKVIANARARASSVTGAA